MKYTSRTKQVRDSEAATRVSTTKASMTGSTHILFTKELQLSISIFAQKVRNYAQNQKKKTAESIMTEMGRLYCQ